MISTASWAFQKIIRSRTVLTEASGFSLLELVVTLSLTVLFMGVVMPASMHLLGAAKLYATRNVLIWQLRTQQQDAQTKGEFASIVMSKYTGNYWTMENTRWEQYFAFDGGVNYVDGYLQMTTGRYTYDELGECEVSGILRLTDGFERRGIELYRGSGLQVPVNLS